jgi:3-methylcrotonyl-CoA carboxylase alpha subunit
VKLRWREESRDVAARSDGASIEGRDVALRAVREEERIVGLEIDGTLHRVRVARKGDRIWVWCRGGTWEFTSAASRRGGAAEQGGDLLAPMPGRVRRALVSAGDSVSRGQVVMILEAMKMEHAIRAPRDGVVSRIAHGEGDLVEAGVALVELGEPVARGREPAAEGAEAESAAAGHNRA